MGERGRGEENGIKEGPRRWDRCSWTLHALWSDWLVATDTSRSGYKQRLDQFTTPLATQVREWSSTTLSLWCGFVITHWTSPSYLKNMARNTCHKIKEAVLQGATCATRKTISLTSYPASLSRLHMLDTRHHRQWSDNNAVKLLEELARLGATLKS